VRPVGGETTVSYVVRLADANHVAHTKLFRYLGHGISAPPVRRNVLGCDVLLNP
jgi:hypothetical protein